MYVNAVGKRFARFVARKKENCKLTGYDFGLHKQLAPEKRKTI